MSGQISQNEGATFEELLEWTHKSYLARGLAAIYHNRIAGKFVGENQFVPDEDKGRPDFSGTLRGGRSVHFDCKTMGDSVGWILAKKQIHQYKMLLDQARMGAVAFFLVECRSAAAVYLLRVHPEIPVVDGRPEIMFAGVPIGDWRLERHVDHRFKHRAVTAPVFCLPRNADGNYDWLTAVETFWLGRSTLPPHPRGRPTVKENARRDEQIRQLAKTQSRASLEKDFHLSQARIAQIVRSEQTYVPRAVEEKP